MTGSEISAAKTQNGLVENDLIKKSPLTPIRKPQSPRTISSPSQSVFHSPPPPLMSPTLLKQKYPLQSQSLNTALPSLLQTAPSTAQNIQLNVVTTNQNSSGQSSQQSHLPSKDLLFLLQQRQRQQQHQQPVPPPPQPVTQLSNGPSASQVPMMVTDTELHLQEERVRLLRQQLLAAECPPQS